MRLFFFFFFWPSLLFWVAALGLCKNLANAVYDGNHFRVVHHGKCNGSLLVRRPHVCVCPSLSRERGVSFWCGVRLHWCFQGYGGKYPCLTPISNNKIRGKLCCSRITTLADRPFLEIPPQVRLIEEFGRKRPPRIVVLEACPSVFSLEHNTRFMPAWTFVGKNDAGA